MKASTFRKRFPDAETNSNCLVDVACPECGNRDSFRVQVVTVVEMSDDGTDGHEDTENTGRFTQCVSCGHEGRDSLFHVEGLDA